MFKSINWFNDEEMENQTQYLNRSRTLDEWNHFLAEQQLPFAIVLIVYMVVGIFGNSVVVYIYLKKLKPYSSGRYFIPFLAAFDLFACVLNVSGFLSKAISPLKAFETDIGCQIHSFLCVLTSVVAISTVILIAIDRYLTICRPNGRQMTRKWKRVSIIITICFSTGPAIPRAIFSDLTEFKSTDGLIAKTCGNGGIEQDDWAIISFVAVTLFVFAQIMTLSVLYFHIYRATFRKQNREKDKENTTPCTTTKFYDNSAETDEDDQSDLDARVMDKRAARYEMASCDVSSNASPKVRQGFQRKVPRSRMVTIFIWITIIYSLSSIPRIVLSGFMQSSVLEFIVKRPDLIYVTCFVDSLFIINYFINPILYGFMDTKFKAELKKILCSIIIRIRRII